ncbi:hypothetical protein KSF_036800 [Reticulibacter mediterranei]|uniref:Uncharacterized protein n=1 Tax=Reticulibacter mediterranei TaxID=2778369 RepID=A0A8J3N401_9CHLR|nr:hypothetical protein KSF_036800 [Reticulibacter mediterranei]
MIASSNEKKPCWFCNLGADQMCLRPERKEYMAFRWYSCDEHHLLGWRFIRALVHFIGGLLDIELSTEKPCWCCKMDMQPMCLKPRRKAYELAIALHTCQGHRLQRFHIGGSLARRIAARHNRDRNTKG